MRFYIKVKQKGKGTLIGEIKIGDFCETFEMAGDYWTSIDYEQQWIVGLRRVLEGKDSCLITSMTDPKYANYIMWWTLYVRRPDVLVHNQLLFLDQLSHDFSVDAPYAHIPVYSNRNEEGDELSEWKTTMADIEVFLESEKARTV